MQCDESADLSTDEGSFGPQPISRLEVCHQWLLWELEMSGATSCINISEHHMFLIYVHAQKDALSWPCYKIYTGAYLNIYILPFLGVQGKTMTVSEIKCYAILIFRHYSSDWIIIWNNCLCSTSFTVVMMVGIGSEMKAFSFLFLLPVYEGIRVQACELILKAILAA